MLLYLHILSTYTNLFKKLNYFPQHHGPSPKNFGKKVINNHLNFQREMITWPKFSWSKLSFFSWSKVLINILSLDWITWPNHLTESVDRNFKITQNDINKSFDQLPKKNWWILAVDQNFLNEFKWIELVLTANF